MAKCLFQCTEHRTQVSSHHVAIKLEPTQFFELQVRSANNQITVCESAHFDKYALTKKSTSSVLLHHVAYKAIFIRILSAVAVCFLAPLLFLRCSNISVIFTLEIYGSSELLSWKLAIWPDLAHSQKGRSIQMRHLVGHNWINVSRSR